MKKLPVLLCFGLLIACTNSELASDRDGIKYKVNSQTPFNGASTEYHKNGQLRYEENYKDGKRHGSQEYFYENGQLRSKLNYKFGKVVDGVLEVYKDGQIYRKANYENGTVDMMETYDKNGQLKRKIFFKDDKKHGLQRTYGSDGKEDKYSPKCYQNGYKVNISYCK